MWTGEKFDQNWSKGGFLLNKTHRGKSFQRIVSRGNIVFVFVQGRGVGIGVFGVSGVSNLRPKKVTGGMTVA